MNSRFTPPTSEIQLAESIVDKYAFTRKRTLDLIDKIGYIPKYFNIYSQTEFTNVSPTLTTSCNRPSSMGTILIKEENKLMKQYAIRKLTPTECFRLMGLTKEDADKCYAVGMSDSALYKQAGNGIVTNCVQLIFEHLYKAQYDSEFKCMDEDENFVHGKANNVQPITANILFSGVGMQDRGIENSECWDFNMVSTSEIDKNAVVSYAAIHCGLTNEMVENFTDYPTRKEMVADLERINLGYEPIKNKVYDWQKTAKRKTKELEKYWLACKLTNNLGDISRIEKLPYADLWTYSFPCTDLSVAGKMKGMIEGETRSGLLYEVTRLLETTPDAEKPKYLLLENVKNLVGKQFKPQFDELCEFLETLGYNNYWQVINAKNCGIPQNRERVFMLSIRKDVDNGGFNTLEHLDEKGNFKFANPFDNGLRLKDVMFDEVEDKYYITSDNAEKCIQNILDSGYEQHDEVWLIPKSDLGVE